MVKRQKEIPLLEFAGLIDECMKAIEEKEPELIPGLHPDKLLTDRRYGLGMAYQMYDTAGAIFTMEYDLAIATFYQAYGMARIFGAIPKGSGAVVPTVHSTNIKQ